LHNDELHSLYSSPNIVRVIKSRRMRWAGHVARIGEGKGVYSVMVGRPEGKRPLERPRRRWDDNIKLERAARDREVMYNLSYLIPNLTYSYCSLFIQTRLWGPQHGSITVPSFAEEML
jgi:hypothetical protein